MHTTNEQLMDWVLDLSETPWQGLLASQGSLCDSDVAFLALGANLAYEGKEAAELLCLARAGLARKGEILAASSLYISPAWPDEAEPAYVNAVIAMRWPGRSLDLLAYCHGIEDALGRTRHRRWSSRTMDVDLLAHGARRAPASDHKWFASGDGEQHLILPHPRAHQRRFVLAPWVEIAPHFCHPVLKRTVAALLSSMGGAQLCEKTDWAGAMALHRGTAVVVDKD